jgi:hypothetical protein
MHILFCFKYLATHHFRTLYWIPVVSHLPLVLKWLPLAMFVHTRFHEIQLVNLKVVDTGRMMISQACHLSLRRERNCTNINDVPYIHWPVFSSLDLSCLIYIIIFQQFWILVSKVCLENKAKVFCLLFLSWSWFVDNNWIKHSVYSLFLWSTAWQLITVEKDSIDTEKMERKGLWEYLIFKLNLQIQDTAFCWICALENNCTIMVIII